ncbi:MAG TPA: acetamidase/formamidase family protein [Myxococcales bacterium]|jgi:acetamidase/formamidase|nr:acetamidase/formamidase family protein [Myxococcales bacterium]
MTFPRLGFICALTSFAAAAEPVGPRTHRLDPSPTTVAWGHYDAAAKPALRISSGDTVIVRTLITSTPARLEKAGVPAAEVEPALREIDKSVTDKGPGGHILTGPIFVEGAEPGDALEVHIDKAELAIPYAYNGFGVGRGFLPDDFPYSRTRIIPLDARRMVARFAEGIEVPLRPFFGSIGVAPPPSMGRIDSAPPGLHGGNLDNKDLTAGSVLYLPVYVPGGLLEIGDGHAAQGNGEVDITAIETSLVGTFRVMVRKDLHLTWPRAETPTHWIAMGMDRDLWSAAKMAVRQAVDLLASQQGLSRDDAYMLASVACDVEVTQLVDGNVGVHVRIPKAIFTQAKAHRSSP